MPGAVGKGITNMLAKNLNRRLAIWLDSDDESGPITAPRPTIWCQGHAEGESHWFSR
jgi:hypothetical protein